MREITFALVESFFRWCINQTIDKNGNRKRQIGTKGTLITSWCNFRLVYRRETRRIINARVDSRKVYIVCAWVLPPASFYGILTWYVGYRRDSQKLSANVKEAPEPAHDASRPYQAD